MGCIASYNFHEVGHGLFVTGTIKDCFNWVYDCGARSPKHVIKVIKQSNIANQIDLLCISHFDDDHVNGLQELLKGRKVSTVVLPYYTKIQKAFIAIRYWYSPIIQKLLFYPEEVFKDPPKEIIYIGKEQNSVNGGSNFFSESLQIKNKRLGSAWEFFFVVKKISFSKHKSLMKQLATEIAKQPGNTFDDKLKNYLAQNTSSNLKNIYFSAIKDINRHSLLMYVGFQQKGAMRQVGGARKKDLHTGVLCTGDCDLSDLTFRNRLKLLLGLKRISNISILQIPHHGSRYNWPYNCPPPIISAHCWSVFPVPDHAKKHPHPLVYDSLRCSRRLTTGTKRTLGWELCVRETNRRFSVVRKRKNLIIRK